MASPVNADLRDETAGAGFLRSLSSGVCSAETRLGKPTPQTNPTRRGGKVFSDAKIDKLAARRPGKGAESLYLNSLP